MNFSAIGNVVIFVGMAEANIITPWATPLRPIKFVNVKPRKNPRPILSPVLNAGNLILDISILIVDSRKPKLRRRRGTAARLRSSIGLRIALGSVMWEYERR